MATVIDSLLIELGLDTSKFNAAQKKSVEELRKFDEQADKTAKKTQKGAKETGDSFDKTRDALMRFGAAAFGVAGLKNLISSVTSTNVQLGRQAGMLGMSVNSLSAWGQAVKAVGGNAEDFSASMQNIEGSLASFSIGLGGPEVFESLTRLGVGIKDNKVNLVELSAAISNIKDPQKAWALASPLMGRDTFLLMREGPAKMQEIINKQAELNRVNEEAAKQSANFNQKTVELETSLMGLKNSVMGQMYPALEDLASITIKGIESFKGWDAALGGALSKVSAFEAVALPLVGVLAALGLIALPEALIAAGVTGAVGAAGYGAYNYFTGKSGSSGSSGGGSRTQRDHNPGALKDGPFARAHGAIGADSGGFAVFPDEATGSAAQMSLLNLKSSQGMNTLRSLIYGANGKDGWLGHGADMKDASSYLVDMQRRTGLGPDQQFTNMELIRRAQAGHEAGTPNTTNSTVAINTLNVNTQATDANGIAKDMHSAIQQRAIIDYGIVGNQ